MRWNRRLDRRRWDTARDLRRRFELEERVTSSDARDPHVAAQLIERIGWALAVGAIEQR